MYCVLCNFYWNPGAPYAIDTFVCPKCGFQYAGVPTDVPEVMKHTGLSKPVVKEWLEVLNSMVALAGRK